MSSTCRRRAHRFRTKTARKLMEKYGSDSIDDAIACGVDELRRRVRAKGFCNRFASPPYDPSVVAALFGVPVRKEESLRYEGQIARLDPDPDLFRIERTTIQVRNEGRSPQRQRYTIAHEVGHLLLWEIVGQSRKAHLGRTGRESEIERLCDMIAVELLAPAKEVRALLEKINFLASANKAHCIVKIARIFDVSLFLASLRVKEIREPRLGCMLANLMNETVEWSFGVEENPLWDELRNLEESASSGRSSYQAFNRKRGIVIQRFSWTRVSPKAVLAAQISM